MDKNIIFTKTQAGEEAMRQRTRLVQRNLRNILIMVDGHASVGDLARRFGDATVTEHALGELERSGYIENLEALVFAEVKQAAQRNIVAPTPVPDAAWDEDVPMLTSPAPGEAAVTEPGLSLPPPNYAGDNAQTDMIDYHSLAPTPLLAPAQPAVADKPVAQRKPAGDWIARLKAMFAPKPRTAVEPVEEEGGTVSIRAIRRGPRQGMSWLARIAMTVVVMVAGLALLVVLFPYERYLPDIEHRATAALNEPVKIGGMGFSFLPHPNITLERIRIGGDGGVKIGVMRVVPDVFSLFGENPQLRSVQIEKVTANSAAIARVARWRSDRLTFPVIAIGKLDFAVGDLALDGFSGEMRLKGGAVEQIVLSNDDSSLKLELRPNAEHLSLTVGGSGWKTPFAPNLTIDHLDAIGELRATGLQLQKLDLRAYEGLVAGKVSLAWDEGASLSAELDFKRLNLARLLPALNPDMGGEGELSGAFRFSGNAPGLSTAGDALKGQVSLEIRRGALRGFDLVEAVRNTGRTPTRGGVTRFEQLSAELRLDQGAYGLSNLKLNSGLLKASGSASISRDKAIDGIVDVELKGSANQVRVPVSITGSIKEPLLLPGRRGAGPRRPAEAPG